MFYTKIFKIILGIPVNQIFGVKTVRFMRILMIVAQIILRQEITGRPPSDLCISSCAAWFGLLEEIKKWTIRTEKTPDHDPFDDQTFSPNDPERLEYYEFKTHHISRTDVLISQICLRYKIRGAHFKPLVPRKNYS